MVMDNTDEPPHCDHEHIYVGTQNELTEYVVCFTIQCISCEKFGRLTLTKGRDKHLMKRVTYWIEAREWD